MIGEKSAIRRYRRKLSPELQSRYGSGPYTQAQVDRTVAELRLSKRHIRYAYLMHCEEQVLDSEGVSGIALEKMRESLAATAGAGIASTPIDVLFGGTDGDGGGFGDRQLSLEAAIGPVIV